MTTSEASEKFGMRQREIQQLCKENLIPNVTRPKRAYVISDELSLLLHKNDIKLVLRELLKMKNYGNEYPINRSVIPDGEICDKVIDYLYRIGVIGEGESSHDLRNVKLTEDGFKLLFEKSGIQTSNAIKFSIIENINPQIGLVNTSF